MAKPVDIELKKAFADLHVKLMETAQKVKAADEEIKNLKNSMHRARLVDSAITGLDPSTNIYQSVGRMFLLTNIPDLQSELQETSEDCAEKIKILESKKSYLERSKKDSENNIREMIRQRREKAP